MKQKLKLALVGRPNVGKSALFNRICNKRISIVDEAEGITRDRLYADADFFGFPFQLIDTGGIDYHSKAPFNEQIRRQAEIAIIEADTLVMVVDAQVGITELDHEVAKILLKTKKPLCLAVNKVDFENDSTKLTPFYALGIEKMVPVSAAHGHQIAELLELAFDNLDRTVDPEADEKRTKIAIVGRPNVGKSSLINTLIDEERVVVSPIAGTTRDSIDIPFLLGSEPYTLIDTAGVRRKGAEHEVVDKFAAIRTEEAIERADICLLMIDAESGLTVQDKKIANRIEEAGKGCILLINKWDLLSNTRMEHYFQKIKNEVPFLEHCPVLFLSVLKKRNLDKIFPIIKEVSHFHHFRVTTGQLNKFVEGAMQRNHPPMMMGKRLRIYYMAQVEVAPPTFILFVNHPDLMATTYKKYLYNQFRDEFKFTGVPIRFFLRGKSEAKLPD